LRSEEKRKKHAEANHQLDFHPTHQILPMGYFAHVSPILPLSAYLLALCR
jgi:hypothetical protein